ncbi:P-loop containing nucleoside triphosphate hydrolase superfamily protein [Trifolium repens]|nr:P-loop containing nucleoside triphosphate hydrolase superfamily protein [Trifolium repens]KAK2380294.1 P-loop containing nucleoside triphosphate hydrolase superfamily protein [Trifolium repens]
MDGLPLLEKNFYNEFPSVRAKTEVEVNECRLCRKITVEGKYVPNFVKTFSDAAFPDDKSFISTRGLIVMPTWLLLNFAGVKGKRTSPFHFFTCSL